MPKELPSFDLLEHAATAQGLITTTKSAREAMHSDALVIAESNEILGGRPPSDLPGLVILSESPLAYYVDGFISADECSHIIQRAAPALERAETAIGKVGADRTNSVGWVPAGGDAVLETIEDRLCDLIGCRPECTESFQVIHYGEGQEYRAHVDGYDTTTAYGVENCRRGGNRLVTTLMYLNEVGGGGATAFTALPGHQNAVEVEPVPGRVLVFHNTVPGASHQCDPRTEHAGCPVTRGAKWACNKWIRQFQIHPKRQRRLRSPPPAWSLNASLEDVQPKKHGNGPAVAAARKAAAPRGGATAAVLAVLSEAQRRIGAELAAAVAAEEDTKAVCRAAVRHLGAFAPSLRELVHGVAAEASVDDGNAIELAEKAILDELERWFVSKGSCLGLVMAVPRVLQLLYEQDAISEDVFVRWWSCRPQQDPQMSRQENAARFSTQAAQFIEWLQEAEIASSTDDEGVA